MMGKIYSQCWSVLVWLGELGSSTPCESESRYYDHVSERPNRDAHRKGCRCKEAAWKMSEELPWNFSPVDTVDMAVSALSRFANVETCEDLQHCRIFRGVREAIALRRFINFLSRNSWHRRVWVAQEFIMAPRVLLGVGSSFIALNIVRDVNLVAQRHQHGCHCAVHMYSLNDFLNLAQPFAKLGRLRDLSRVDGCYKGDFGYFWLRRQLFGTKSSLDHDLVYGLLGPSRFHGDIIPQYYNPVGEVYRQVTERILCEEQDNCDCAPFTVFNVSTLRSRYKHLPSWVIDYTIYETHDYDNVWIDAMLLYQSAAHRNDKSCGLDFREQHLVLHGRFFDYINVVGDTHIEDLDMKDFISDRFLDAVHSWRRPILERHSAGDPYVLPHGYSSVAQNWATAWLKMICAGCRFTADRVVRLTLDEIETAHSDSQVFPSNIMMLDLVPTFRGKWEPEDFANFLSRMKRPDLYLQICDMVQLVLANNRMLLTHDQYLGFGNRNVQGGDKLFLSARCGRPLVLRPVEGSLEKWKRTTYRIVSACYLEGFMDGPDEGAEFPYEEVWIE